MERIIMNESVFQLKVSGEALYGIWHQPCQSEKTDCVRATAIVMLHGWGGYRTGPHDMLVKLSRQLAENGYHCFRFDFRGKGYSQGDRRYTGNKSMLEDLEEVLQYVKDQLVDPEIILTGICSGAKIALYYARNGKHQVGHVIELSSPVLRQIEVESTLAVSNATNMLQTYIQKSFRKENWRKMIHGEVNFSAIWQNITRPVTRILLRSVKKESISKSDRQSKHQEKPFSRFNGQILLIHGEKDPETRLALKQIHEMLNRHQIGYETHVIKNANHSFYSLDWEREVIGLIGKWLMVNVVNN